MNLKIIFFPLCIVLSLVISIWMTKPQWDSLSEKKLELEEKQKIMDGLTAKISGLGVAAKIYADESENSRALVLNAIPYDSRDDVLLSELYQKIKESGVWMQSIKIDNKPQAPCPSGTEVPAAEENPVAPMASSVGSCLAANLSEVSIALEISGDYLKIKDFIRKIEIANRLNKIAGLSLQKREAEGTSSSLIIDASLELNAFYKADDASVSLAKLVSANSADPAFAMITQGKLSTQVIRDFEDKITKQAYSPSFSGGITGKEDLFFGTNTPSAEQTPIEGN